MSIEIVEPKKGCKPEKKRVCAYARVSTDSRKQGESLENQISSYERSIKANPEYEFAGVYADQGISGYSRNRPEFQKMIQKARNGEIDLIITKAISRFARNTAVLLEVVRKLRQLGIAIYFEEQNINTLSGDGEVMLTVLSYPVTSFVATYGAKQSFFCTHKTSCCHSTQSSIISTSMQTLPQNSLIVILIGLLQFWLDTTVETIT